VESGLVGLLSQNLATGKDEKLKIRVAGLLARLPTTTPVINAEFAHDHKKRGGKCSIPKSDWI
jgi:hypothetical protein